MALPDLIEIVPLPGPVQAEITVPGSKSITNRALILAALAGGETTLRGALWSEDTQVMVECLQELGFMVNVAPDSDEACNRTITVYGQGGTVPRGGSVEQPLELFVGNAGTAARFLAALVCLGEGVYRLHGVPRMHERPQAALFQALRQLGYRVDSPNDKLPALLFGGSRCESAPSSDGKTGQGRPRPDAGGRRRCTVSIEESSQFASALLLGAKTGGWQVEVTGENAEESPYVAMTSELIKAFPQAGGTFQIEPDASSGSYFWAVHVLTPQARLPNEPFEYGALKGVMPTETLRISDVTVNNWPATGWQIDEHFLKELVPGAKLSRRTDLGDSIMTAIVLAPLTASAVLPEARIVFTDLGRLRVQECERVVALRTELTRCGAKVIEEGDTLTVHPSPLHGAEIETYNDHRMAMCFAVLGLKVPGIKIKNPACVKKTFPNFFQKLAAPPPHGLGAVIRDGRTGRTLGHDELFAE
jgi:3-phosphoshikimate 1-carboxyvinyltransferase